ncbi:MAG: hypothetical protein NTU69_12105 [Proteobacteria bacterium]|nr:hypothetical protein [Pseudomonadota bacterium]
MDRSIKKSIAVNELYYIFQLSNLQNDKRSNVVLELFENPRADTTYLLKEGIRTLKDLEEKTRSIIEEKDCIFIINTLHF